ncbi:MAG TPA: ABC transporter substrate binding protein [Casimicrobiaceae bacterium]|nr:ABC transporter substrate binding protein [Casimicrobiaceae bacterium]
MTLGFEKAIAYSVPVETTTVIVHDRRQSKANDPLLAMYAHPWRATGYPDVVPDVRGNNRSDAPQDVSAYRSTRSDDLAGQVAASAPDVVIIADGTGARIIRSVNPTIPIVIPAMADPVAAGLTGNMSRPDNNVTGLSVSAEELSRKRLELFGSVAWAATRGNAVEHRKTNPADQRRRKRGTLRPRSAST